MEAKKLNALIKKIGTNSKKLREDIQAALVGCAFNAQIHRNTTPYDQLFEAVGSGTRKEGMLKWAMLYSPIHFKDGRVLLSDQRQKDYDGTAEEFQAELDQAPNWYELAEPEPVANPWDSLKFAEGLARYLENAAGKAEKNGDSDLALIVKNAEMLFRTKLNAQYEMKVETVQ